MSSPKMHHASLFESALRPELGAEKAAGIMTDARVRYAQLDAGKPGYADRALRQHLDENVLPGLALYETLRSDPDTRDQADSLVDSVFTTWGELGRKRLAFLGRLPFFYGLLRRIIRRVMKGSFPSAGFETEWLEVSDQRVAFNMTRCFYFDTLTAYGYPELTAQYCRLDDLIYDNLSPHVHWKRTSTIARGGEFCDFCYERAQAARTQPNRTRD